MIDSIVGLKDSAARTAVLLAGNLYVEVFEYHSPAGQRGDPTARSTITATPTSASMSPISTPSTGALMAAGMRFHAPPPARRRYGGRRLGAYGRDPDGNVIEMQEILDPTYAKRLEFG